MPEQKELLTSSESPRTPTVDPREYSPSKKSLQPNESVGQATDAKERYASWVATGITQTFTGSCAVILLGIFVILLRGSPDDAKARLAALAPILKEAASFLTSVFGPLLAFVLGYYFGERRASPKSTSTARISRPASSRRGSES